MTPSSSSSSSSYPNSPARLAMARTPKPPSFISDALIFASGALLAFLLFLALSSLGQDPLPRHAYPASPPDPAGPPHDPSESTFYDDPSLSYTVDSPVSDWDAKRREWLRLHPSIDGGRSSVLMVSGSQPSPCRNPVGDHLLLRFLKNKIDYCRLHNLRFFYNTALLDPAMPAYWAKIPLIRAAMLAHPDAEWVWWVDSDAALTDMDYRLPVQQRYAGHNLVVHGWPHLVYRERSWVSLNAGVFLIRNCQWSLDFMAEWAAMGPRSPDYERWGKTLKSTFKDKVFDESDDQSALVYLLLTQKEKWGDKIFLENHFYFEGYWVEIVGRLDNITSRYEEMERRGPAVLRRRHAEAVSGAYARARDERLSAEGAAAAASGPRGWRRPFITHFTGCQPCSGDHNKLYSGENCYEGMRRALGFADDQVLRAYGFRHPAPLSDDVRPLPFDYPAAAR